MNVIFADAFVFAVINKFSSVDPLITLTYAFFQPTVVFPKSYKAFVVPIKLEDNEVIVAIFKTVSAFTVNLLSIFMLSCTPTPPLKITAALVELDNILVLANTVSGSTFEKNCVNDIFLFEGMPAGSSTSSSKSSLAAVDTAGRPEMRLSAILLQFLIRSCLCYLLLTANIRFR